MSYHRPQTDIEWYLENWSRYMRAGCSPAILPKESIGLQGFTHEDTEGAYDVADLVAARATDAAISGDLSVIERAAIHHAYLHAVYRFPRGNFDEVLAQAEAHVQRCLERKGLFVQILDLVQISA